MPFCPSCGIEYSEKEFEYCPECGICLSSEQPIIQDEPHKKCPQCGGYVPADMFYCLLCGHQFPNETESLQYEDFGVVVKDVQRMTGIWKNKWISLILCVFWGWLGIHRFYEGKTITGIIYLFTLGLLGFGWIADIVRLAAKPNPYRVK